ncbi:MAG: HIT family protein [Candidatus Pacearchaeota archaeon]|nr:HIT family protein [Candidatus Pacearchaeota archaeon]
MLSQEQAEHVRKQILEQLEKLPQEEVGDLKKEIQEASAEELEAFIGQLQKAQKLTKECIFCKIIKGEIETVKIFEDKELLCILDIAPASKGHALVMPKQHVQFIQDIKPELLAKLFHFIQSLAPVLIQVLNAKALSIYIPQGQLAGQRVQHFFVNLIPRYENDKVSIVWDRKQEDKKELQRTAEIIRKAAISKIVKELEKEKEKLLKHEKAKKQEEAEKIYKHVKRRRV